VPVADASTANVLDDPLAALLKTMDSQVAYAQSCAEAMVKSNASPRADVNGMDVDAPASSPNAMDEGDVAVVSVADEEALKAAVRGSLDDVLSALPQHCTVDAVPTYSPEIAPFIGTGVTVVPPAPPVVEDAERTPLAIAQAKAKAKARRAARLAPPDVSKQLKLTAPHVDLLCTAG
jgi:hypothetical protein